MPALSQVWTVEPWGLQAVRVSASLLESVSYLLAHAAPLALGNTGLFSDTYILKATARRFLFCFFFKQELEKDFLPELAVAYDILAFILPSRGVGGFVWRLL